MSDPICPICLRPIPPDVPQSAHHLIPKLKGGKGGPTVLLHHICHKEIHATLSEAELARDFNTPDALRQHPRIEKFARWVAKRPPDFLSKVPGKRRGNRKSVMGMHLPPHLRNFKSTALDTNACRTDGVLNKKIHI